MKFIRRIFQMPPSTTTVTSDEKLFFDQDGHLKFGPEDLENPQNYTFGRKCYITAIAISLVMNATFSSSAPSGSFQGISDDLHVSVEAAGLVTTLFLLGKCNLFVVKNSFSWEIWQSWNIFETFRHSRPNFTPRLFSKK
jgi:hypothetical protein